MILAAGRGKRMRPLTDTIPKPLLMVKGKSLIEYHIEALKRAGINELVINTGWLGSKIEEMLGEGHRYNVKIEYSHEPETAYETGGGIFNALNKLTDPFIVVNGDVWTDYDFSGLMDKPKKQAHLVLVNNPEHHPDGDFAIEHGLARPEGESCYTFSGIGAYRKTMFADCEAGSFPLAPILKKYMNSNEVSAEHYAGIWNDVGTPERLDTINRS